MAVIRQNNYLGQERLDIPQARSIESGVAADFDLLAGRILANKQPLIINGFNITVNTSVLNKAATLLTLNVAGGQLIHFNASESGSIFFVPANRAIEVLNSTNSRIIGSFTAATTNYIGIDLVRSADTTTNDLVAFKDPSTNTETFKTVPLARTLDYVIYIQSTPFSSSSNIAPVAIVVTDSSLNATSIEDARKLMFRLGSGGDSPVALNKFNWTTRAENPITSTSGVADPFAGGDKQIGSLKDWMDAVSTRLWETNGGEYWYSLTNNTNIRLAVNDPAGGLADNIEFNGTQIRWSGFFLIFNNSTAVSNTVNDQTTFQTFPDKNCLYVDLNRANDAAALPASIGPLATLNDGAVPGSRFVIAWRFGSKVYQRNKEYYIGKSFLSATSAIQGIAKSNISNGSTSGLGTTLATASADGITIPVFPLVDTTAASATINSVIATGLTRGKTGAPAFGFGAGTLQIGGGTADTGIKLVQTGTSSIPGGFGIQLVSDFNGGGINLVGSPNASSVGIALDASQGNITSAYTANAGRGTISLIGASPGTATGNASILVRGGCLATNPSPDVVIAPSIAGRTGNILEVQSSTGTVLFNIANSGTFSNSGGFSVNNLGNVTVPGTLGVTGTSALGAVTASSVVSGSAPGTPAANAIYTNNTVKCSVSTITGPVGSGGLSGVFFNATLSYSTTDLVVTFQTTFSAGSYYAVVVTPENATALFVTIPTKSSTSFSIRLVNSTGTVTDLSTNAVKINLIVV